MGEQSWWMSEPIRLIQTNLRETDSDLDAELLAGQISRFPANTLLFSVGGIVAHYPTKVEFHYPSQFLPEGQDLVGDMLSQAHARGIRVIGRFDFSRARKEVYSAHPEWFFRNREGNPVVDDNDLYSSCINGGYYSQKAMEVLTEALGLYEVDGLFFNWFGNLRWDYKGNDIGLCHCAECTRLFRARYRRDIPDIPDHEYDEFMFQSSRRVAKMIRDLIKKKRPAALFMTYIQEYTDGIVSEADFYKWRPLPQWIYSASENVNRALNTRPEKAAFNLIMPYQEMRYRFSSVPGAGLRALLYQNVAHGGFPAFVVLGTLDRPDGTAVEAVRPFFQWHRQHEQILLGQKNAGRIVLYASQDESWDSHSSDYRGFYRLLSELHLPFKVTNRLDTLTPQTTDLVVIPEGRTPDNAQAYLDKGGRILVAGTTHPGLGKSESVRLWTEAKSTYMRIEQPNLFPSLKGVSVVFWEGEYLELEPDEEAPLTLIPPSQFGPPDKVSTLSEKTDKPGLLLRKVGKGEIAFLPWNLGRLYYLHSNDKHRLLISDLVDYLIPAKRQLETNAHPQIEITLMESRDQGTHILHLTNLIGHSGTSFFAAPEVRDVHIRLKRTFSSAQALRLDQFLQVSRTETGVEIRLPLLREYEAVVLK
jgi:hypothetical protein